MKKIGILIDDEKINFYLNNFINNLSLNKNYKIYFIKINYPQYNFLQKFIAKLKFKGLIYFINKFFFLLNFNLEKLFTKIFFKNIYLRLFKKYKYNKKIASIIKIQCFFSPKYNYLLFQESSLKKIKNLDLDFLVRGQLPYILKGEILCVCKNGLISIHHGDNTWNRGGPPAYWETYKQKNSTGFIIQRLNETIDKGEILFKSNIFTKATHLLNLDNIYLESYYGLEYLINNYLKIVKFNKKQYAIPTSSYLTVPNFYQSIVYLIKLFKIFILYTHRKLFKNLKWNVAFRTKQSKKIHIIKNPNNHFFADPFIISYRKKNVCFVEDFDFKKNKGQISAIEIFDNGEYKILGRCIEESFHLSFPFVFKFEDQLYMCPETKNANSINIYKCINFPLEWKHHKVIFKNISAVDPMIFNFKETWWLLFTTGYNKTTDHNSRLFVYNSQNPINNTWQPITINPLYNDSRLSRNAGIIFKNNKVFRINQKHKAGFYGSDFSINEILELNKNIFKENPIASKIDKKIPFKYSHHYNSNNLFEVFDFIY